MASQLSREDSLELYGWYKQIQIGDCNIAKPSTLAIEAYAKYKAWKSHLGTSFPLYSWCRRVHCRESARLTGFRDFRFLASCRHLKA